jgi:hypothetical protein
MHAMIEGGLPTVADCLGPDGLPISWRRPTKAGSWTFRGLVALSLVAVAGCSTPQSTNSWRSDAGTPKTAAPQSAPTQSKVENGDPLIRLVGSMPMAVDQGFSEPATGEVLRVRVLRAYVAASGRPCREFVVIGAGGGEQRRVACEDGAQWVAAHPLRQESTETSVTRVQ